MRNVGCEDMSAQICPNCGAQAMTWSIGSYSKRHCGPLPSLLRSVARRRGTRFAQEGHSSRGWRRCHHGPGNRHGGWHGAWALDPRVEYAWRSTGAEQTGYTEPRDTGWFQIVRYGRNTAQILHHPAQPHPTFPSSISSVPRNPLRSLRYLL